MYSLGSLRSKGASDWRIRYSWSSRCIMNGNHAKPLSIQMTFRFGNLSGRPFMIQFVRCTMLQVTNERWPAPPGWRLSAQIGERPLDFELCLRACGNERETGRAAVVAH